MTEQGVDHLWLDATGLERFSARFPTIAASLASIGLDPQRDWLPIAPAAHHLGISGVPFFVFDHRLAVSGAQPTDLLLQALEQASTTESTPATSPNP